MLQESQVQADRQAAADGRGVGPLRFRSEGDCLEQGTRLEEVEDGCDAKAQGHGCSSCKHVLHKQFWKGAVARAPTASILDYQRQAQERQA